MVPVGTLCLSRSSTFLSRLQGAVVCDACSLAAHVPAQPLCLFVVIAHMCCQAELSEMRGLVESLSRKNRHLAEELSELSRGQDAAHTQLLGLQVCAHASGSQEWGPAWQISTRAIR